MLHRVVRPLLRVALLSMLFGALPPAPLPVVHATTPQKAAIAGPPVAASSTTAASTPLAAPASTTVPHPEPPPPSLPAQAPVVAPPSSQSLKVRSLPLAFHANTGQADRLTRFQARGMRGMLAFRADELIFTLPTPVEAEDDTTRIHQPHNGQDNHGHATSPRFNVPPTIVHMRFQGANAQPDIVVADPLPGVVNYLVGADSAKWRMGLSTYAGLIYRNLYPGIDLHYEGTDSRLKSTYTVAPGADPTRLRWRYSGFSSVQVDTAGNLNVSLPVPGASITSTTLLSSTLIEQAPRAWQTINGKQVPVAVRYTLGPNDSVGFSVGTYDSRQPLIIDPTLIYNTTLHGSGADTGSAIAVDDIGNTYVAGSITNANLDAFVTKLTPDGNTVLFETYLGGNDEDAANGIAIDANDNIYLTGYTRSTDFHTANPIQSSNAGGQCAYFNGSQDIARPCADVFVSKLTPDGTSLLFSTYLGGQGQASWMVQSLGDDLGNDIALDSSGNVYVTGETGSVFNSGSGTTGFPLAHAQQSSYGGGAYDAFVTKINPSSSSLIYSTYLGGGNTDRAFGIAVDSSDNAYVTGQTLSGEGSTASFPTVNAYQSSKATSSADTDAFITKLVWNGSTLSLGYSTYLGGNFHDGGGAIAVDSDGAAYITGLTFSSDFPRSPSAYDSSCGMDGLCDSGPNGSYYDAFVTKLSSSGLQLLYSTYLGGSRGDIALDIAVDKAGMIYITGETFSADFPTYQAIPNGYGDAGLTCSSVYCTDPFVAKIDPGASGAASLIYSSYLGTINLGTGHEQGTAIAVDDWGNAYITGSTREVDANGDIFVRRVGDLGVGLPNDQNRCLCNLRQPSIGMPINTRSGNYWTSVTDLEVERPGTPVVWTRMYASQAMTETSGVLGYGWQHPYITRLITPTTEPGRTIILTAEGNRLRFGYNATTNTYYAFPGVYDTLVRSGTNYTWTRQNQQQYVFDAASGRLTSIRDPLGRLLTLTYNTSTPPQLTRVADAVDSTRALTITYTTSTGPISSVSDGTRTVQYNYTNGDLTSVQDVRGQTTNYAYTNHLLWKITDPLNQIAESVGYTGSGITSRVITQTLQDGRKYAFGYLASTTIVTTTGQDGRRTIQHYIYGSNNTLANIVDKSDSLRIQSVVATTFDKTFSPTVSRDGKGNTTRTVYASNGLPTQQTDALGQISRARYDTATNRTLNVTDTLGIATQYTYDALGNLLKQTAGVTTTSSIRATTIYTYTYLNASNVWVPLSQPLTAPLPKDSRLSDQRASDGVVTHYDYDAVKAHQVTKMTVGYGTALKQETTYGYDALGRATSTTVAANNPSLVRTDTTVYNADNTIAKTIQNYKGTGVFNAAVPDQNVTTTYGYDKLGRTIAVTDTLGTVDVTRYNAKGQVEATARNIAKPWSRDLLGQPIIPGYSANAPESNIATQYGYDGLGRTVLVSQTGILTGTFNAVTLRFTDVYTRVTRTEYDTLSRPVTTTLNYRPSLPVLADTNIKLYTRYDGAGNVITQTDALGRWFVTQYDALNRPVKTIANYQDGNPLTGPRDADIVTVTHYDAAGRVDRQTDNYVDGIFTATEPITDRVTLSLYNTLGRTITTTLNYAGGLTDPALNRSRTAAYDAATGRMIGQQDPLGRWVSQQYDLLGRMTATIQNCRTNTNVAVASGCDNFSTSYPDRNLATQTAYDTLNRTTIITDALPSSTRMFYDGLGRTITSTLNYKDGVFIPNNAAKADEDVNTSYRYDGMGRTLAVIDTLGKATSTTYNALGQATSTTDQLGRVTTMGYDGTGTLRWSKRVADGQLTVYQLDGLGRTVATIVNYRNGQRDTSDTSDQDIITRTMYDAAGRRIQQIQRRDPSDQATLFAYDGLDRLIGVTENYQSSGCAIAPCNVATAYQYDRAGNRTKIIDPLSHVRSFTYTAADEQKKAIDALGYTSVYTYDQMGRLLNQGSPRGSTNNLTFTYDNVDRLKTTSATNLGTITNSYDALGRRTQLDDGTGSTHFYPDALGRITQVVAPSTGTILYSYDGRGLRTKLTYPTTGTVINYSYFDDGRLNLVTQGTSSPTTQATYTYDLVGRLAQVATKDTTTPTNQLVTNYGYDGADRLRAVRNSEAGTTIAGFEYQTDRLGLRTAITDTMPLSPTIATTRLKTAAFEGASLTDPVTGVDSVNGTVQLTTTAPLKGFYTAVVPNLGNSYLRKDITSADDLYVTFYLRVNTLPGSNTRILQISNSGTTVAEIQLTTAGKLRFRNAGTTIGLDSAAMTVGAIYRVGVHQKKGTGANAVLEAYLASGDTPFTSPFSAAANQTFTTAATRVNVGSSTSTAASVALDDITFDTATLPQPGQILAMRGVASAAAASGQVSTSFASDQASTLQTPQPDATANGRAAALAALPLSFIPNAGQVDDSRVRFQARALSGMLSFTPDELRFVLRTPRKRLDGQSMRRKPQARVPATIVSARWIGAQPTATMTGTINLPGRTNYITGSDPSKWRTNIASYAGMVIRQLYPGIDLYYQGTDGKLESTYVVAPGADPSSIRWRYQGADAVNVDAAGNLVVQLPAPATTLTDTVALTSTLIERPPVAWQTINEREVAVPVRYVVGPSGTISFALGAYDPTVPLTIDPVLLYSTYLGGTGEDGGAGIAVDASGNAYVSGYLNGTAFVDKLNPSGSAILYSTQIAGGTTPGLDMALDSAGNVYLAGTTLSSSFPFTANAYQTSCNPSDTANCSPDGDAFVVKLNTSGVPIYSSYLGGSDGDQGIAVAADNSGKVYITGITASTSFPTKTPIQSCAANGNIFVTKIDTTLSGAASLIYSTCLGGNGADWGNDIAIDASGAAYIAGWSTSTDFTTTSGVVRPTHTTSEGEGVVIKLNAAGTSRTYATYLGGSGYDSADGIAIDSSGNAYVTGATFSTDLPHPNGEQAACAGSCTQGDSFVLILNTTATTLTYGTYLGGTGADAGTSIALDNQNRIYATGFAGANFPVTPDRLYGTGTSYTSNSYLIKLNPSEVGADSLVYSTYLGGNDYVNARAIAVDAGSNAYVTGETEATDLGIAGAVQLNFSGDPASDVFVLKVNGAQRLTRYSYDGLGRLIGANERPGSVYTYTYDLAGNRTSVQLNGGTPATTTYNAANQITSAGYTYDGAGNLTNDGTTAYTYDALSRTTARGSTTYAYNGDGTLVSQTASSVTTKYTQDLAAPLTQVLQTQVGAATRTDYLYGLSRLASLQSGVKTWYAADALGSVRRTVTDAGVPLGLINYDPWGTVESGTVPTFGFTGELQDATAGLVNLRARWYSTARGRFNTVDPFAGTPEQPNSLHQYAYGYSDPVGIRDPSGKTPLACFAPLLVGPEAAPATGLCLAAVAVFALGTYATYEAIQCAQQSCLVGPVQNALNHFSNDVPDSPNSTANTEPPPPYEAPPGMTGQTPGRDQHILSHPLPEEQYCPPLVFPLETPSGPYTSAPWEQPVQMPQALMAAPPEYRPLDRSYGAEGRATGAKATLVKPLKSGPKFLGAKMKYSSFRFDYNKYDRSHLIPKEFGGRGIRENIVPLYRWINQETKAGAGPLRDIEKKVLAAVEAGFIVEYEVVPIYNEGNTTQFPDAIRVKATWEGTNIDKTINNTAQPSN